MSNNLFSHASLSERSFNKLSSFIEENLGIKMPVNKKIMLESRLQKRLKKLHINDFDKYLEYLFSEDGMKDEYSRLIDVVTTNKTDFFRESNHFDFLRDNILSTPPFNKKENLNIWSSASSTGEEAYTIAIVMEEFCAAYTNINYSILATDISEEVLDVGKKAVYDDERINPVPPLLRNKYFLRSKDHTKKLYRIKPDIRKNILFKQLNLMDNYSLQKKMDIVFCRNILIYFDRPRQEQVLRRIIQQIKPGGILFLGHSETLTGMSLGLKSIGATVYKVLE